MGLRQLPLRNQRLLLLLSTPTRLYAFIGPATLEGLGAAYPPSAGDTHLPLLFPSDSDKFWFCKFGVVLGEKNLDSWIRLSMHQQNVVALLVKSFECEMCSH